MDVDASRTETRKCYNCNKVGHLSRNCPDPPRPRRVQATTNAPDPTIGMGPPQPTPSTNSDATIAAVLQQMEELRKENADLKKRLEEGF